ncbi:hypothetical protein TPA0906_12690 [Streptomyces olivaceus]|nr:hypothetical protein TPA0906_12690 [Streptomyces olivaceus]
MRLLVELRAPEAVPALITTLERRLRPRDPYRRVALACVEGLGTLADDRAEPVLNGRPGPPGAGRGGGEGTGPHPGAAVKGRSRLARRRWR